MAARRVKKERERVRELGIQPTQTRHHHQAGIPMLTGDAQIASALTTLLEPIAGIAVYRSSDSLQSGTSGGSLMKIGVCAMHTKILTILELGRNQLKSLRAVPEK